MIALASCCVFSRIENCICCKYRWQDCLKSTWTPCVQSVGSMQLAWKEYEMSCDLYSSVGKTFSETVCVTSRDSSLSVICMAKRVSMNNINVINILISMILFAYITSRDWICSMCKRLGYTRGRVFASVVSCIASFSFGYFFWYFLPNTLKNSLFHSVEFVFHNVKQKINRKVWENESGKFVVCKKRIHGFRWCIP